MISYLQTDKRQCERHGEYEAVFIKIGDGHWTGCPTCAIERQKESEEIAYDQFHKERLQAQVNYGLRMACIPPRMANASFDSFKIELGDEENAEKNVQSKINACREFSNFAHKVATGTSGGMCILAIGPAGTGKTHLACATIRYVAERSDKRCRYVSADEIVSRVFATYGSNSHSTEQEVIREFSEVDLLVIDENASAGNSEAKMNIIFSIMNNRYNACLPSIMIGNLSSEEIRPVLGDRLYDRMKEMGKSVPMAWPSCRGKNNAV